MTEQAPIPMILTCPMCRERHVDAGEFATKSHHTHACQYCGFVWRPAIVPTVGVQFLPGFKDEQPYIVRCICGWNGDKKLWKEAMATPPYLCPSGLNGPHAIIAEQSKDTPIILRAMGTGGRAALLRGGDPPAGALRGAAISHVRVRHDGGYYYVDPNGTIEAILVNS